MINTTIRITFTTPFRVRENKKLDTTITITIKPAMSVRIREPSSNMNTFTSYFTPYNDLIGNLEDDLLAPGDRYLTAAH